MFLDSFMVASSCPRSLECVPSCRVKEVCPVQKRSRKQAASQTRHDLINSQMCSVLLLFAVTAMVTGWDQEDHSEFIMASKWT